jgi:hypothetical protein
MESNRVPQVSCFSRPGILTRGHQPGVLAIIALNSDGALNPRRRARRSRSRAVLSATCVRRRTSP